VFGADDSIVGATLRMAPPSPDWRRVTTQHS
jgi:hypothetical protein